VCYPPGGKNGQNKPHPEAEFAQGLLAFEIVAYADRPKRLRRVGTARGNSSVLDPQPKRVITTLSTRQ
jgi:ABC-type Fe2+-enterobactin transport system substrate-binding protein